MAVTAFPSLGDSPDLTLLNAARLFTRLEHNLLSPGTELRTLRGSEFQRMRVAKVSYYVRSAGVLIRACIPDSAILIVSKSKIFNRMSNTHAPSSHN
jgi:hypothetical protein